MVLNLKPTYFLIEFYSTWLTNLFITEDSEVHRKLNKINWDSSQFLYHITFLEILLLDMRSIDDYVVVSINMYEHSYHGVVLRLPPFPKPWLWWCPCLLFRFWFYISCLCAYSLVVVLWRLSVHVYSPIPFY